MQRFLIQAQEIVAAHRAQYIGIYYMGDVFTGARDLVESGASLLGNYFLPGSSILTDQLVSKGAQKELSSPIGEIGQLASGAAGGGFGESFTGIPAASEIGAGWSGLGGALGLTGPGGVFGGVDASGITNPAGASTTGLPATAPASVPGGGAISAAGSAAPAGVGGTGSDVTSLFNDAGQQSIGSGGAGLDSTSLNSVGSQIGSSGASSPISANVGSGTVGTPSIPSGVGNANFAANTASANAAGLNFANPSADIASAGTGASNVTGGAVDSAGAATGGATKNSLQSFLANPSFASAGNILTSNPNTLLAGAGLGLDALKENQTLKGENNIKDIAGQEQQQGALLQNYLQTGTLPPGLQAGLTQASKAAEASIRSQYAARGMSGSSAEAQDIANLQQTVEGQGANMALQLLQTGISETGAASALYEQIMNSALQKDKDLGSAISSFSSAAAGGLPGGLRLTTGA